MYRNWNKRVEAASTNLKWYRVQDIVVYVHGLREYIINAIGKRSETYTYKLQPVSCPAARNNRFPENEMYVCEGVGEWCRQIDQLLLLVSIIIYPNKLERQYYNLKTKGDTEMAFLDSVSHLLHEIEALNNVIDRATFETRYNLQWIKDNQASSSSLETQENQYVIEEE
ncbi:hypothetical protein K492DRAFT_198548 [Lichtheimia hyalospora FSU 10163]|nr:hypothetical protein K492DRAFT_198548 [Lichtheimia hyalospora FSU 10163]